ncbi:MAG: hypothetical protein EA378_04410 [Phycisphaerales bacterium]|nr:MAG: hypothetical protein EA378_04410 [Phycisphaerales bacterium]
MTHPGGASFDRQGNRGGGGRRVGRVGGRAQPMGPIPRERFDRFALRAEIRVTELEADGSPGPTFQALGVNLSRSGIAFSSKRMVHEGRGVFVQVVTLHASGAQPRIMFGYVKRCAYEAGRGYVVGVQFAAAPMHPAVSAWLAEQQSSELAGTVPVVGVAIGDDEPLHEGRGGTIQDRRHDRTAMSIHVEAAVVNRLGVPGSPFRCRTRDLSSSGLALLSGRAIEVGHTVLLRLPRSMSGGSGCVAAVVRRCEQTGPGEFDIGLACVEMPNTPIITAWIAKAA